MIKYREAIKYVGSIFILRQKTPPRHLLPSSMFVLLQHAYLPAIARTLIIFLYYFIPNVPQTTQITLKRWSNVKDTDEPPVWFDEPSNKYSISDRILKLCALIRSNTAFGRL